MKNFLVIIAFVPWLAFGQQANARSKSELGFMVGGSSYLGDLNQFNPVLIIAMGVIAVLSWITAGQRLVHAWKKTKTS